MGYGLMIWEMTVSIWSSPISIWDICHSDHTKGSSTKMAISSARRAVSLLALKGIIPLPGVADTPPLDPSMVVKSSAIRARLHNKQGVIK